MENDEMPVATLSLTAQEHLTLMFALSTLAMECRLERRLPVTSLMKIGSFIKNEKLERKMNDEAMALGVSSLLEKL